MHRGVARLFSNLAAISNNSSAFLPDAFGRFPEDQFSYFARGEQRGRKDCYWAYPLLLFHLHWGNCGNLIINQTESASTGPRFGQVASATDKSARVGQGNTAPAVYHRLPSYSYNISFDASFLSGRITRWSRELTISLYFFMEP